MKLKLTPGGDGATAFELITAPSGKYLKADMYTWYWHPYIDPSFNLSVVTKAEWYNNSDTGFDDPLYDSWWKKQSSLVDVKQRQALVWKMEAYLAEKRPYIQLVVADAITAQCVRLDGLRADVSVDRASATTPLRTRCPDPCRARSSVRTGVWLRCQLHAHTTNSDGEVSPAALCDHYADAGFDVLAITDHWHVTDVEHDRLVVIPSSELTADAPTAHGEAEALALGVSELPEAREPFADIEALATWIVEHGGVPVPLSSLLERTAGRGRTGGTVPRGDRDLERLARRCSRATASRRCTGTTRSSAAAC